MSKVIQLPVRDELSCTSCGVKQRTALDVPCILCGGKLVDGDPHPWAAPPRKDVVR
jgi:hypothetical protein